MNSQMFANNPLQNIRLQMNIVFESNKVGRISIPFYYGTTINQALITYLSKIGRSDLINKTNKILFIFNGRSINFNDQTKIEDYFHNLSSPVIRADFVNMINVSYNRSNTFDPNNNPSFRFHQNLEINQYQNEINELKKQLKEKDDKISELKNQAEEKDCEINEFKKQVNEKEGEISELKRKAVEKDGEINKLKKQAIEEHKRLEANKKNYWDLYQRNEFLMIENEELKQNKINLKSTMGPGEKLLIVYFNKTGKQNLEKPKYSCKNTELFVRLEERFYKKFPEFKEYNLSFVVNGKRINRFKTIDENQIRNNDTINIIVNN